MGVMRCYRTDCDEIGCHHRLAGHYICTGCLSEIERAKEDWPEQLTEAELHRHIEEFFESERGKGRDVVNRDGGFGRLLS